MDRNDASALADLQMHWDEAYEIGLDGDIWLARFHGSADELRAHTSSELRELIRADYAYRSQARTDRAAADDATDDADPADGDPDDIGADNGDPDDDAGDDASPASSAARRDPDDASLPEHRSFAGIRGERMST